MFCTKCGTENPGTAVYCQKCGELIEPEEETRVASRTETAVAETGETKIFSINPTLKFVMIGYVLAIIGAILLVALLTMLYNTIPIPVWIAVPLGLALLLIPAFYHFKRKLVRYTLTDTKIEIDEGLISRTTRNVPLRRIQDVTVSSTISQRILGFGSVIIDNASEDGGKIILKNIDSPKEYADILLKQMRQLER